MADLEQICSRYVGKEPPTRKHPAERVQSFEFKPSTQQVVWKLQSGKVVYTDYPREMLEIEGEVQ